MNFPFTQGQSRRPNLSEDSVAPDPGRPRVVTPGSTHGRSFGVRIRGRIAVDRTHGSTPGRFLESCCCAWRVWCRPEVDIPQLSAVVAPGSTSLVVCCGLSVSAARRREGARAASAENRVASAEDGPRGTCALNSSALRRRVCPQLGRPVVVLFFFILMCLIFLYLRRSKHKKQ